MGATTGIRETLQALVLGRTLSSDDSASLFEDVLTGRLDDAQIASALTAMAMRGVTVPELVGAAGVMRRHVTRLPGIEGLDGHVIDTCGTGGAPKTFNISTIAALVAAAAAPSRVRVAKHGNRSRTGRGSAEVLAALGVHVDASPAVQTRCLEACSVCFCFAVHHHPAMKFAAGVRRSLAFPTIFNLLGPLTNPAGARRQLMGIYDAALVPLVAEALRTLGAERAMVVHSFDGLDELSTAAPTRIAHVTPQGVREEVLDPASLGLARATLEQLSASTLEEAVAIARGVLAGEGGPRSDIVALNASAALVVGGAAATLAQGLAMAREAIASGAAKRTLDRLAEESGRPA